MKSKLAVASFIISLATLAFVVFSYTLVEPLNLESEFGLFTLILGVPVTEIVAIILGIIALVKIKKSNNQLTGKGFAIAGIIIAAIPMVFLLTIIGLLFTY